MDIEFEEAEHFSLNPSSSRKVKTGNEMAHDSKENFRQDGKTWMEC